MTAFGKTYCQVSNLPINDGDEAIKIPLKFNLSLEFNPSNENMDLLGMTFPFQFYKPAEVVRYNGHPSDLTFIGYTDSSYEYSPFGSKSNLFMLIHKEFFFKGVEISKEGYNLLSPQTPTKIIHDQYWNAHKPLFWVDQLNDFYHIMKYLGKSPVPCGFPDCENQAEQYLNLIKTLVK